MRVQLWSINKWLRWTGFRITLGFQVPVESGPTWIGVRFWGWSFIGHEPHAGRWHVVDGEWQARW
jgi:hypothetical protein